MIPVFSANFGGPVNVVRSISKELAKRHEVTVYTTAAISHRHDFVKSPIEIKEYGYRTFYFPRTLKLFEFNISPTMAEALKENINKFDIIHLHSWRHFQDIIVHHYAKRFNVPYVLQVHGSLSRNGTKRNMKFIYDATFGKKILKNATKVIALSPVEAKQYEQMGILKKKIAIVPNGIDLLEYNISPLDINFRNKFKINENKKIILYLGRINKSKGIDFLVKAYSHLTENEKNNDVILIVSGPDDGFLNEIKKLVCSLGLNNKIIFTGFLSEKDKIMAYYDSNVLINVEPKNVFGLVPLEAAACSTPVIVSKGNAISDIINKGNFGYSINYGNINELTEVMEKLLNNDKLSNDMGNQGKKFVFKNFKWNKIIDRLERVYQEVIIK